METDQKLEINQTNQVMTDVVTPSIWTVLAKEFMKDKLALFCLFLAVGLILTVFIWSGFFLDVIEVTRVDLSIGRLPWGYAMDQHFILGTDPGGRSILHLVVYGARNSLIIAFSVAGIGIVIGSTIGLIAGFYGGHVDNVIMRTLDFVTIIPTLMVMILIITIFPRTMFYLIVAFWVFGWIGPARLVRMVTLQQSALDYVKASKTLGTPNIVIIFREVIPNIISFMMTQYTLILAGTMGIEVGLTMLGFGLPITTPTLGALLRWAMTPTDLQFRPWFWVPAGSFVLTMVLCINYVGQAIGRAADARRRRA